MFNDIVELRVELTNRYSNRDKNNLQFTVTDNEMMKFIAIIFLSGYNKRTCETDYWSKSPDLECLIVASAMSRTRFQHIKSYLHAADNQNLSETKMAKIEPLYQITSSFSPSANPSESPFFFRQLLVVPASEILSEKGFRATGTF